MASSDIDRAKQAVRERVWALLEREQAAPPGVHGRIPAFVGAQEAANRLAALPQWKAARVIKAVPDTAQLPVRAQALEEGKVLYMAVPKLADELPFYVLDAGNMRLSPREAASKEAAAAYAPTVDVDQMQPVDMIVCGSVAVNRDGVRLGKGAGYSDIEVALLAETGLLSPNTTIVTTVHSLQVLDEPLPEAAHDFSIDFIVTPDEVIACQPPRRPTGLYWDALSDEKIAAIPALSRRSGQHLHNSKGDVQPTM